jgi:hypothetical protein
MQPTGSGGCPFHRPITTQYTAWCLKCGTIYGHAGCRPYRHIRKRNVRSYLHICFCRPLSKRVHKVRARGCHVLLCEWIRGTIGLLGCSAGLGIANESGLTSKRGCLDVFLGKVFCSISGSCGKDDAALGSYRRPNARMQDLKRSE